MPWIGGKELDNYIFGSVKAAKAEQGDEPVKIIPIDVIKKTIRRFIKQSKKKFRAVETIGNLDLLDCVARSYFHQVKKEMEDEGYLFEVIKNSNYVYYTVSKPNKEYPNIAKE